MPASSETPRIAMISAVTGAITPAASALRAEFEDVDVWNILDDRLLDDAGKVGGIDAQLQERMRRLIAHAESEGADAVLLTCSQYGVIAENYESDIPVLSPDGAAFAELARASFGTVLIIASIASSLDDTTKRLGTVLRETGARTVLGGITPDTAAVAARADDPEVLARVLIDAVRELDELPEAIFLAQYSLSPAAARLAEEFGIPVISGPGSSARVLHERLIP